MTRESSDPPVPVLFLWRPNCHGVLSHKSSPAVSWVGMVRGSVRPEAAAVPAARALSCAREQTPEQRAVLGSEAVVNHLGCNANEAWPGAWS